MANITHVELFDGKERTLGAFTIADAAARMQITQRALKGYVQREGYCLVDDPEVIMAKAPGETITVNTAPYERAHGHKPRGRGYWMFRLCTDRVTEKDHLFNSKVDQSYDQALKTALELATRRRANCIMVLP